MPRARRKQFETFTDGILSICKTEDRVIVDTKLKDIRFGNRTIGERRYFDAQTAGNKITKLLSIPAAVLNRKILKLLTLLSLIHKAAGSGIHSILREMRLSMNIIRQCTK